MSEATLQRYMRSKCKTHSVFWRKMKFEGQHGCPDVMIAYEGQVMFVELKSDTGMGRLSGIQEYQIEKMRNADIIVRVISTKEGVDDVIREIKT
jgi:hypothetical protein